VNKLAEASTVVFATDEVTVHTLLSPDPQDNGFGGMVYHTESKVLLPGQFLDSEEVPPYLLKSIKEGTSPGLEIMTHDKAAELSAKAAEIRAIAGGETVNVQGIKSESQANKESLKLAAEAVGSKKKTTKSE
jgi:hypothetical protein